jgi:hypothetical protein
LVGREWNLIDVSERTIHQGDIYSKVEVKLQLTTLKKVNNEENLELWNSSKCSQGNRQNRKGQSN